jgi:hypothetical protein
MKTAVEWLEERLKHLVEKEYFHHAKKMEKEQHQETFKQSRSANIFKENMTPAWESWEEYYKQTFKQQEQ